MNDHRPRMSIVITTYNRAHLLPRALDSALAQTLPDIEIVVVDDGSTDDTTTVLDRYPDNRLRVIRLPANRGSGHAYTAGVEAARGEILLFLDSDDALRPQAAERLSEAFAGDRKIGMAWGRKGIWDHHTGALNSVAFVDRCRIAGEIRMLPIMLTWTPGTGGLAVRREVFDAIGTFDPAIPSFDLDFTMRFAAAGLWGLRILDEILYDVYLHGPSMSTQIDLAFHRGVERILEKHHDLLRLYPVAQAAYFYRAAHSSDRLGERDITRRYINQAIRLFPFRPRFWAFKASRYPGLAGLWGAVSAARARRSALDRKLRYEREAGIESAAVRATSPAMAGRGI